MIELSDINKTYIGKGTSFHALHDVTLSIDKGEWVCIMGRSGCGKTTLMNILGLMDRFDTGIFSFDGTDVRTLSIKTASELRNRELGFVFQSFNLVSSNTAFENVEMPLGYAGISTADRKRRVTEVLSLVGLADKAKNRPSQLSGGQQQRVAIARALVNSPKLILADEPTGNLDKKNGQEIMELLKELHQSGVTIILVSHDPDVASYATRTIHMEDGRVLP